MKTAKPIKSANLFPVVGIGASAGGLDAFKRLLKAIPENSGMAYVLVQHLDPTHESLLPELLQKVTSIPVLEIADDIKVKPDHIYVIPSNKMMVASDGVLLVAPRPAKSKNERNLPIDLFFTSLAQVHEAHAIGVVLSGIASDGTLGLKAIKDHGGITFAQDEVSAAYEGMPHSAVMAGVVDFILPPEEIPQKILEISKSINGDGSGEQNQPLENEELFKHIISLLRIRKGTDFTYYKQTTIRRRILRRMALNKNEEPAAYLDYLRGNKSEQDILFQDMLIPVTSFFRDPKSFDNLCQTVFPLLVKNKIPGEPIRAWVAGCSTGEEAYSVAMCFKEFLVHNEGKVQIFATDISEPAITKARSGIYSKNDIEGLTPQRLREFFTKTNDSYQLNRQIRDMCVFAVHNFLKDPPFGKMDFISCRNVLIYMEPYLQKKALSTFHYSLNPKGFLLIGKSETTGGVPDLFVPAAKNDKLFSRKDVPGKFIQIASQRSEQSLSQIEASPTSKTIRADFQKTADDIMLSKYTPAGVVVNEEMDIVHFRGSTGSYLEQSPGKPSHNLLQMAKNGLAFELLNIIHKAKKEKVTVIKENIPLEINGNLRNISIEAIPLPDTIEPYYLILFHDHNLNGLKSSSINNKKTSLAKVKKDTKDLRIKQLEHELAQIREDMRSITEDQEAANEELQSANEELLSSSEELQSLNEELETGKEELQSTNEELTVVNQKMIGLNEHLATARDYSEAIVANIREPLLVLDKSLRIKSANDAFYKTFRVHEAETEGALIYDLGNKQWNIPALRILLENILPKKLIFNDFEVTHTFSNIGERIMLLNAREIINKDNSEKLILVSIEDITDLKKAEKILSKSGEYLRQVVKELPAGVYSCDANGLITSFNNAAVKLWGREPEIGKENWCGSWKMFKPDGTPIPLDNCPMAIALAEGRAIMGEEIIIERPDGSRSTVLVYPQPEFDLSGKIIGAINMVIDITEIKKAERVLRKSEEHFRLMADTMPQKVWTSDAEGNLNYFNSCWFEYTGLMYEDLKGSGWEKVIHPDDLKETKKNWLESIKNGENFEIKHRFLDTTETYKWHLTRGLAQKDENGKIRMWIGTDTEIQKQQEQNEELEKAITERTSKLQEANITLKGKNKELESFAYVSSHDLQEPLRKIQAYAGRITLNESGSLTDTGKEHFRRMQEAAKRMQTLIEDLLAFSRVNSTERIFVNADLGVIIKEVKNELKDTIKEKNATVETGELCPAFVIEFQFRQLLLNLIGNALKFSKSDTPPHIMIKSNIIKGSSNEKLSPEKQYCHITVEDNGIGFEPEFNERIFEVFQKLHGREVYPGTGIGLSIVKKIVENHNGVITVTSELNKGTRFDIYIPA